MGFAKVLGGSPSLMFERCATFFFLKLFLWALARQQRIEHRTALLGELEAPGCVLTLNKPANEDMLGGCCVTLARSQSVSEARQNSSTRSDTASPAAMSFALGCLAIPAEPARGHAVTLPFKDAMSCVLHVDDMAEVFARVVLADKPAHPVYNSGGTAMSLGEIAAIVRSYLPDARINFDNETGAKEGNSTYLLDNSRLLSEFAIRYPPFRERVLQIINDVRRDHGLSCVG